MPIQLSPQAREIDERIGEYLSGEKNIMDIPIADNLMAGRKIYFGINKINRALTTLLIPDPTPINEVLTVGYAVWGVLQFAWGLVDLLIPAEEEL